MTAFHGHVLGELTVVCVLARALPLARNLRGGSGRAPAARGEEEKGASSSSDVGVRPRSFFWGVTSGARPVAPQKEGRPASDHAPDASVSLSDVPSSLLLMPVTGRLQSRRR